MMIYDFDLCDYINSTDGVFAIDIFGRLYRKINDNTAMLIDTGEIHITSSWENAQ